MKDIFKKTFLMGLGAVNLTKDKIYEWIKELEKMGEISAQEGDTLLSQLQDESAKAKKNLEDKINTLITKSVEKLPCHKICADLEKRLTKIEEALNIKNETRDEGCNGSGTCNCNEKEI